MDSIEFILVSEIAQGFAKKQIAIECKINSLKIATWKNLPIDFPSLMESAKISGEYYIWTCSCGIPECANITKGIDVLHDGAKIKWSNNSYPLKKRNLEFDKEEYCNAIKNLRIDIKKLHYKLSNLKEKFEFCPTINRNYFKENVLK